MLYNILTSVHLQNALQHLNLCTLLNALQHPNLCTTAECSTTSKPRNNYRMFYNV
ncbi:hypothetical protein DPMN_066733 [Dreissena polymorpha]|uniref:Uncharacterized protein n=1 Tax=Dreissena polymorpha TaxID=45954 RepID=A0A9D3YW30_DREPO|nr:hypothetical protein DPMN_066733 [Dreissena polymorpha]